MLLAGLWCSTQKPPSFAFLQPVFLHMKDLEDNGVEIDIPGKGQQLVRAQLLCAVMDLPAKAAMLNCIQYNGAYGCSTCKHPGCTVKVGRGSSRAYGYKSTVQMREHDDHNRDAQIALNSRKVVSGVKGFSPLHLIPSFDIIRCVPVDYMHCVLLGVIKKLAKLWFTSTYNKKEWYIGRRVNDVDKRLLQIKPPDTITRTPRSIKERPFWKASEWKSFLLYYGPATLHGILPNKFYLHLLVLAKSIRILLGDSISEPDLLLAENLLKKFCKLNEEYYGIANCGINVHLLGHLCYYVRCFGPLWTHSAFAFEGQMHYFLRHSHATHGVGKQIVTSHLLNQALHVEREILLDSRCSAATLLSDQHRVPNTDSSSSSMIGKGYAYCLLDDEMRQVNELLGDHLQTSAVRVFNKAVMKGKTFFSKSNTRVKKRNDYTVAYVDPSSVTVCYGIIDKFIKTAEDNLAVVLCLTLHHLGPLHNFGDAVSEETRAIICKDYVTYEERERKFIFLHQIVGKCFNLSNCDWKVLTSLVNSVEFE